MPLFEETFTSAFDATRWFRSNSTDVLVTGGQLRITPTTGYPYIRALPLFNLTRGHIQWEHTQSQDIAGTESWMHLRPVPGSNANEILMGELGGQLVCRTRVAGVQTQIAIDFDPTAHRWQRVRFTGTQTIFETSPTGATWTARRTITTPAFDHSGLELTFTSGRFGAAPGTVIPYGVDNVKVGPLLTPLSGFTIVPLVRALRAEWEPDPPEEATVEYRLYLKRVSEVGRPDVLLNPVPAYPADPVYAGPGVPLEDGRLSYAISDLAENTAYEVEGSAWYA